MPLHMKMEYIGAYIENHTCDILYIKIFLFLYIFYFSVAFSISVYTISIY